MKILYFAPKEQLPIIRLLFRGYKFKGVSNINELIQYMCDPFLICLFDSNYRNDTYQKKFSDFQKIFGKEKIGEINFDRQKSEIYINEQKLELKRYVQNLGNTQQSEKRSNLRIQPPLDLSISILSKSRNQKAKCINISTDGICILSEELEGRFIDLVIDGQFTAQAQVCWKKPEENLPGFFLYGLSMKLDESDKFKRFIKNKLLSSQMIQIV